MKKEGERLWCEQHGALAYTARQGMTFLFSGSFNCKTWKYSVASIPLDLVTLGFILWHHL